MGSQPKSSVGANQRGCNATEFAAPLTDTFNRDNQLVTKAMTAHLLISGTANPAAGVTTGTTVAIRNGVEFQFSLPLTYGANPTPATECCRGLGS